jgi:hypothetical protein
MPAARANAAPVDCEAARCTVQATIDAECSCADAKNHGRYTSCVAHVVNRLASEGTIPKKCRNKINGCAIRSTCGKKEGSVAAWKIRRSTTCRTRRSRPSSASDRPVRGP